MRQCSRLLQFAALILGVGSVVWALYITLPQAMRAFGRGPAGTQMLVVSLLLYLTSHVVRMARLWLLIGGGRLRELLRLYWYTTAVSLAVPFKMGELIRILEIGWSTKGPRFGLVVVWVERAFDAALLSLAAIGLAYSSQDARPLLLPLIGVLLLFVALSLIFLWVLPENLPRINLHIMRLYSGRRAVRLMRSVAYMKTFAEDARRILKGRMATFAILTLLIWTFELFAIASVMAPDFPAITGFTELLTKLVPGLSQVESYAGMQLWTMTALSQTLIVLVFGLVALFPYICQRLNGRSFTGNRDDNAGCLR